MMSSIGTTSNTKGAKNTIDEQDLEADMTSVGGMDAKASSTTNVGIPSERNNDMENNVSSKSPPELYSKIPKKKRRRTTKEDPVDDDGRRGCDDDNEEVEFGRNDKDDPIDVSLDDLKRQILGRNLREEGDSDVDEDAEVQQIRALMNNGHSGIDNSNSNDLTTTTSLADRLRNDLMCAICHEIVYPPISLLCGHSFCQPCVDWWLHHDSSCPTCRQSIQKRRMDSDMSMTSTNLALRACVMAMYGKEIVERLQSKRPKGERGGAHDGGYQTLSDLNDETWQFVKVSSRETGSADDGVVQVRRSTVLDADDQRMQLALSIYKTPEKLLLNDKESGFRVKLCLLTMEEDEVEDSGFPINVINVEDEHLMCSQESRFVHSFLQVQMRDENGNVSPLARVSCDGNGYFDYILDPTTSAGDPAEARSLLFQHSDTGSMLEVDLAQMQSRAGGGTLRPQMQPNYDRRTRHRNMVRSEERDKKGDDHNDYNLGRYEDDGFVVGQHDRSDDESEDGFEDDGFLVDDENHGSDVEGAFSDENDHNLCVVCREGGELMVCDGGKENDGCGRCFHSSCVNRFVIPDGDWICQDCSEAGGIEVGPEGHEFPVKPRASESATAKCNGKNTFSYDNGDEEEKDEMAIKQKDIRHEEQEIKLSASGDDGRRRVLDDSSSEKEDEKMEPTVSGNPDQPTLNVPQDMNAKRRRVLEDSDSD